MKSERLRNHDSSYGIRSASGPNVRRVSGQRQSLATRAAAIAICFLSWTFPRIGFLKISEAVALLAAPRALLSEVATRPAIKCYWPFVLATLYSLFVGTLMVGHGDNTLTSEKGFYSSPTLVLFITLIHIGTYLVTVISVTYYFSVSNSEQISRTLRWTYYVTLFPGFLQIFRIYTHIYFSIPFLERADVGPFSGVFDAGYLRIMGFEFEPLGYATSLVVVCCLSLYNGRRIPWLGMIVLLHTYGTGAIAGLCLALFLTTSKRLVRLIVPLYAIGFALLCWWVKDNIQMLAGLSYASLSLAERIFALNACVNMWIAHPMGIGLGLYGYFFNHYNSIGRVPAQSLDWYPNNDPAMFLVYGGLPYFCAYLYTFYFLLRRSSAYWLLVACAAILFQSASSYLFFNPAVIVVFSMMLANASHIPRAHSRVGEGLFQLRRAT